MLRIKHKLRIGIVPLISLAFMVVGIVALPALGNTTHAASIECVDGTFQDPNTVDNPATACLGHGGAVSSETDNNTTTRKTVKNDCNGPNIRAFAPEGDENHCGILDYLMVFINVLSGIVGVVVVTMVIIGGIQYSAAQDNPNAVSAAKKRITNAVLALLVFIFMFAFLQWLVPGGLF